MNVLRAFYKIFCKAEVAICALCFIAVVVLVFMSAILRFFRVSMAWNIDMAMLLLAWSSFLGADIAYRSGQLVGIDMITRNLPKKAQKIIEIVLFVIIFAALVFIVFYGIRLSIVEWNHTYQSIPIPYSTVLISLPFAALSMAVSTILKIKYCIAHFNN
ncbi:MAG: TRAP transporter small permease subunit [Spirochaetaceae bacterium]|jgi:TRAP-type C4-dicarboxylate transport system permease small subunit|nr:TRAP transporter small permease subunit [Spirochaetaceae bacterium]